MSRIKESGIERLALGLLQKQGFQPLFGPDTAPDGKTPLRKSYEDVLLRDSLSSAIDRLNPGLPPQAKKDAFLQAVRLTPPSSLIEANERFHKMITEGISVSVRKGSESRGELVWLIDFQNPENNEYHAVNQFTVIEGSHHHRADIALFVNGLPLAIMELKRPGSESPPLLSAFRQLQTYKKRVPSLFAYNGLLAISDGMEAKAGSLSAGWDRFMAWPSIDGKRREPARASQLETLIKGALSPKTLLDIIQNFTVFEKSKQSQKGVLRIETVKKQAACHQYHAANKALMSVIRASAKAGSRRGGVIWHTQGSGKSLTMAFAAGKIIRRLNNPTILVITDRNDLDNQLFDTFAAAKALLRQKPRQARTRADMREMLKAASGGVVFATIQKFRPEEGNRHQELSRRENIVVIADEAHRTQYGFMAKTLDEKDKSGNIKGKKTMYGFAKYMRDALPSATYLGFTGTPIESADKNTRAVFGAYLDIYDIARAVEDKATVPIFYESRLAKVSLGEEGKKLLEKLDRDLAKEDFSEAQKSHEKTARMEALIGNRKRVRRVAGDIVSHFEERQEVFKGKGLIVAMSRRIALNLYREIIRLRPAWRGKSLKEGVVKIVMTVSAGDGPELFAHRTTKEQRRALAGRMRDPDDDLKLAIVVDMWLTGFDVPCLHTLYIDKPLRGHSLMQAIARVNRVYKDKPGGLVADYLGIASDLRQALAFYSAGGGKGEPAFPQKKAVSLMREKLEIVSQMFHGFGYKAYFRADTALKLKLILAAAEHILKLKDGKRRFISEAAALSRALALAIPHEQALAAKDEAAFFQAVRARLVRLTASGGGQKNIEMETVIRQTIDKALVAHEVIDVFSAAGIKKPDISILSDEFLLRTKSMRHQSIAVEMLKRLLKNEIKSRARSNVIQGKTLKEMLEKSIRRYHSRIITAAEVIEELIKIAKDIQAADREPEKMGLSKEEYAFWTAVADNKSAVEVMGKKQLRELAMALTEKVRQSASIDWQIRKSARARLRVIVKRLLRKYGYPPDMERLAADNVLKQAEALADQITGGAPPQGWQGKENAKTAEKQA